MLVVALETLLERGLLRDKDVDLHVVLVHRSLVLLLGGFLVFSAGFLVDQTLASEEVADQTALFHHVFRYWPDNADHARKKALNAVVLKQNVAGKELSQNAAETPDVNLVVIAASQDDFGGTVRARLNIAAQVVVDEARAAKVNDLDLTARIRLDQNVLRLQIAVDQLQIMDKAQRVKNLLRDPLQPGDVEVDLFLDFSVVLAVLVEIVSEEFSDDEQVLFVVKVIDQLEQVFVVEVVAVRVDVPQQLYLVYRLVKVILVVFNDLHADHLLSVDVVALDCF